MPIGPLLDAYALALRLVLPFLTIALVFEKRRAYDTAAPNTIAVSRDVIMLFAQSAGIFVASWLFGFLALLLTKGSVSAFTHTLPGLFARGALVLSIALVSAAIMKNWWFAALLTLAFTLSVWAFDVVVNSDELTAALATDYSLETILRGAELNGVTARLAALIVATVVSHLALAVVWLEPNRARDVRWAATLAIFIGSSVLTGIAGWAPRVFLVGAPIVAIVAFWWWKPSRGS